MKLSTYAKLLGLMLITVLCAACGPNNTVPLTYTSKSDAILPAPNAPRVAVVVFDDRRTQSHLGQRSDNTTFVGTTSVTDWMSRSFAEELRSRGVQVSLANSLQEAKSSGTTYIVTGSVTETQLTEESVAQMRASMQAEITLHHNGAVVLKEGLSASQGTTGLKTTGAATELLQKTVQELLRPGVDKVASTIGVF